MHEFSSFYGYGSAYSPFAFGFMGALLPFLFIAVLWTLVLKGFALWHAARAHQKWWFIALLVINTFGILEIIYLVWFRPTTPTVADAPHHAHPHASHTPEHHSSAKA